MENRKKQEHRPIIKGGNDFVRCEKCGQETYYEPYLRALEEKERLARTGQKNQADLIEPCFHCAKKRRRELSKARTRFNPSTPGAVSA